MKDKETIYQVAELNDLFGKARRVGARLRLDAELVGPGGQDGVGDHGSAVAVAIEARGRPGDDPIFTINA